MRERVTLQESVWIALLRMVPKDYPLSCHEREREREREREEKIEKGLGRV